MKVVEFKYIWVAVALAIIAGSAMARETRPPRKQSTRATHSSEAAVLALEDDWTKALVRHDMKAMAAILAKGMVYTENDSVSDRDSLLRDLAASKEKIESAKNEEMKARTFGDTVVVTGRLIVKGAGAEGPYVHEYRFTDVWMRRNGRWQIVAAQDYLKPDAMGSSTDQASPHLW